MCRSIPALTCFALTLCAGGTAAANEPDAVLLAQLLGLTDPAEATGRAEAVRALGASDDSRAAPALIYALEHDRVVEVQVAAAEALGQHRGEFVEAALARALVNGAHSIEVQKRAVAALALQGTPSAARHLWDRRGERGTLIGDAVRGVLAERFPDLYAEWRAAEPEFDSRGPLLLVPVMGLHGGWFMTALADIAGGEPGLLSFAGGMVLGGTTPYLLSLRREVPVADAAWISSTTTFGLASGPLIAMSAGAESGNALLWSSIGGQAVGLGAGLLTLESPFRGDQIAYIDTAGTLGGLAGGGIVILASTGSDNEQAAAAIVQSGIFAGLLGGALAAPSLQLDGDAAATLSYATAVGTWWGIYAPGIVLDDAVEGGDRAAGALIGAAVGYAGGTVVSELADTGPETVGEAALGGVLGTSMFSGAGLLPKSGLSNRAFDALVIAGGLAGSVAGGVSAPRTRYSPGDRLSVGFGLAWGLWQGAAVGNIGDRSGDQAFGAALLGTGLGGTAASLLAQPFEPEPIEVGVTAMGGVWGGWLVGWAAHVADKHGADLSGDDILTATLIGSDVGAVTAGLTVSPWLRVDPRRLGWISASGAIGMGLGTSVAAVVGDDVAEGNVIGSSLGLVVGAVATSFVDFGPRRVETGGAGGSGGGLDGPTAWWPNLMVLPEPAGGRRTMLLVTIVP